MTRLLDVASPRVAARLGGTPLVVMLDVDGTLAPIVAHPSLARVPDAARRAVSALAARDGVRVALVSGRAATDARRLVASSRAWVIGNHGAEVLDPEGDIVVDPRVGAFGEAMAAACAELQRELARLPGIFVEDKRWTLAVHWRNADASIVPRVRERVAHVVDARGLRVTEGKAVFEVRPPVPVDKGAAVISLAERLGALAEGASLLYAGDDVTDEDAFRAVRARTPRALTIHIGPGWLGDPDVSQREMATSAEFTVPSTEAFREFLESILRDRS